MNKINQPNIVFILSDQHNGSVTGNAGDKYIRTPHLDRLAENGVRLDNCYSASPLCVPSRSALLTGLLPQDCRVYNNNQSLHSDLVTIAHAINVAGYQTVLSGRMHFTGPDQNHGFEQRLVGDVTPVYHGHDIHELVFGNLNGTFAQKRSTIERAGAGYSPVQSFDEDVLEQTEKFLINRKDPRPLFLTVGLFCPHPPHICPEKAYEYYYGLLPEMEKDKDFEQNLHPAIKKWLAGRKIGDVNRAERKKMQAAYYGLVEFMDGIVGKIIAAVDHALGLENTVIVYTSDHGEAMGVNNLFWKGTFYEGSVKVPVIISYPNKFCRGKKIGQLTSLLDLTSTFIELTGAQALPQMYGQSLLPALTGETGILANRSIISQIGSYPGTGDKPAAMIRKGDWKLISYYGYADPQMFNLKDDPNEIYDLGTDPQYAKLKNELLEELNCYWDGEAANEYCELMQKHFAILAGWSNTTKFPIPSPWHKPTEDYYLITQFAKTL